MDNGFRKRLHIGLKQWAAAFPYLFLGVAGTAVFVIYPMIKNILVSLQDYSIMPNAENPWVGLDNYRMAFTDPNRKFLMALRNTFLNTLVTVPINWFCALVFAVLINLSFIRFKITFRTIYYLPIITSWIVVAFRSGFCSPTGSTGSSISCS